MVVYFPSPILLPKGNNSIQRKVLQNKAVELASLRSSQSPKCLENLAGGTQKAIHVLSDNSCFQH